MTLTQFNDLLNDLESVRTQFPKVAARMTFENKILCVFIWLVKYPTYEELAYVLFGTNASCVSSLIRAGFVNYFQKQNKIILDILMSWLAFS